MAIPQKIKKFRRSVGLILLPVIGLYNAAYSIENVLWQGSPLPIEISVGTERRIDLPEPIVDMNMPGPEHQATEVLLTREGRLFLKPKQAYGPTRIKLVSMTGELYMLDVTAVAVAEGEAQKPISTDNIVVINPMAGGGMAGAGQGDGRNGQNIPASNNPDLANAQAKPSVLNNQANNPYMPDFLKKDMTLTGGNNSSANAAPDYIAMARYAMSHFAGPKRLIPKMAANQVAVKQPGKHWLRVVNNGLEVRALAQWNINGHFVTAIYVRNKTPRAIEFDPRGIRGDIKFVGAMHTFLRPRGESGDEGLWAVVTDQPFNIAIK